MLNLAQTQNFHEKEGLIPFSTLRQEKPLAELGLVTRFQPVSGFARLQLVDFNVQKTNAAYKSAPDFTQMTKIFRKLSGLSLIAVQFIYGLGLKAQECRRLRFCDLNLTKAEIFIRGFKDKRADRVVMMPDSFVALIKEILLQLPVRNSARIFGSTRNWIVICRNIENAMRENFQISAPLFSTLRKWGRIHKKRHEKRTSTDCASVLDLFDRGPLVVRRGSSSQNGEPTQYYLWSTRIASRTLYPISKGSERQARGSQKKSRQLPSSQAF